MHKNIIPLLLFITNPIWAAPTPLLKNGPETFKIVDSEAKPAKLRILEGSLTKQTLAVAVNAALQFTETSDREPSGANSYVEIRPQKITIYEIKGKPGKLGVTLRISDKDFEMPNQISKTDLLKGKVIAGEIPPRNDDLKVFQVNTRGDFRIQYRADKNELMIYRALLKIKFENPLSGEDFEQVAFTGKGIRSI